PDDDNDCTWDACAAGVAGHLPKRDGTPCNTGTGVCEVGQCAVAPCAAPDGMKNGNETGVDCGGTCAPCAASEGCRGPSDCDTGFCASGACAERIALAVAVKSASMTLATYKPGGMPAWTTTNDAAALTSATAAGVAFDAAGEAVGLTRTGGSGAR